MTGQYGPRTVLVEMLSCIARENHIYLAANLGRQTKTASGNVRQYNTDVVFDRCGPPLLISYVKTQKVMVIMKRMVIMKKNECFSIQ